MDKILERWEDHLVRGTYIYMGFDREENVSFAYSDPTCKTRLSSLELKNLFIKGAIVVNNESYYLCKPISFFEEQDYSCIVVKIDYTSSSVVPIYSDGYHKVN